MRKLEKTQVKFRTPVVQDGQAMWKLAKESQSLDLNSAYSYLMLCEMFKETCCIAEHENRAVGFVSGFHKPLERDTLFIWQIAVSKSLQGQGIARMMLRQLLARDENSGVRYIEASVGPDNLASRKLFLGLAAELGAECALTELFKAELFPDSNTHADEILFRIGPI